MAKQQGRVQEKGKTCLLVLGMHRSGTSALTGLLSQLGCETPQHLMEPSPRNAKGFFESVPIHAFNQELLASAGTTWDDYGPVNEGWLKSPLVGSFHQRALEVLEQEFGTSPFFVLKDPRICRLLPFWRGVLDAFGCVVKPILTVRQPAEVAASLKERQNCDETLGQFIWLRHVLEAERGTRGMVRFHTSYDSLLDKWSVVADHMQGTLGFSWPRSIEQAAGDVSRFLTPDLRHHNFDPSRSVEDPLVNKWVRAAYEVLAGWVEHGEQKEDYGRLDEIFGEFDMAARGFRRTLEVERSRTAELLAGKKLLEKKKKEADEEIQSLRTTYKSADAARKDLEAEIDRLSAELENVRNTVQVVQGETQEKEARLGATVAKLTQAQGELEVAQGEIQEKEARLGATVAKLTQAQGELEVAQGEIQEKEERLSATLAELEELRGRLQHTESALAQRKHEVDETLAQYAELRENNAALQQENAKLEQHLQTSEAAQRAQADAFAKLQESSTQEIATLKKSASERFKELAALTALLHDKDAVAARNEAELKAQADAFAKLQESSTQEIAALKDAVSERFGELAAMTALLHDKDAAVARNEVELSEVKHKLRYERERRAALRSERDGLLQERDQHTGEIEVLRGERDHFSHEVGLLRNSTSWKITGPLRRVVQLVRGS